MQTMERIKTLLEQSGLLPEQLGRVQMDHLTENRPGVGLFPLGKRRLSAWEREKWQQDFLLQLSLFAMDEAQRSANAALLDSLSRWAVQQGEAEQGLERLTLEKGRLLYPAGDGLTFVYQMEGSCVWWEEHTDQDGGAADAGESWWLKTDPQGPWLALGDPDRAQERTVFPKTLLIDRQGTAAAFAGRREKELVFEGKWQPQDRLWRSALQAELCPVSWLRCGKSSPQNDPAVSGTGFLSAERIAGEEQRYRLTLRVSREQEGVLWQDDQGSLCFWKE